MTDSKKTHFDCHELARQARLDPPTVDRISRRLQSEYPQDELLLELHTLRAYLAARDGLARVVDMLREPFEPPVRRPPSGGTTAGARHQPS